MYFTSGWETLYTYGFSLVVVLTYWVTIFSWFYRAKTIARGFFRELITLEWFLEWQIISHILYACLEQSVLSYKNFRPDMILKQHVLVLPRRVPTPHPLFTFPVPSLSCRSSASAAETVGISLIGLSVCTRPPPRRPHGLRWLHGPSTPGRQGRRRSCRGRGGTAWEHFLTWQVDMDKSGKDCIWRNYSKST